MPAQPATSNTGKAETYSLPIRRRIRLRWLSLRWRVVSALDRRWRPERLHPDDLSGYDGEPPYFLRFDLAGSEADVVAYFRRSWGDEAVEATLEWLGEVDIDTVWMVPHVPTCSDPDCESDDHEHHDEDESWYDVVPEGTAGAIRYWRWSE
jgi:hypothetical protein